MLRSYIAAALLVVLPSVTASAERASETEAVANRAAGMIRGALDKRTRVYGVRLARAYKQRTASWIEQWIKPEARVQQASRAYVRKLLEREARELGTLKIELAAAQWAATSLGQEPTASKPVAMLSPPVRGAVVRDYGSYRHRRTRARLVHRGRTYAARSGDAVSATARGRVRHVGPVRGLGTCVVIATDRVPLYALVCGVSSLSVNVGERVRSGQTIGQAEGATIYMEIRGRGKLRSPSIDPGPWMVATAPLKEVQ